jgi:hypothetical protein
MADQVASPEMLERLSELEQELQETKENMMKAAMLGKSLVEDNDYLKGHVDDLMKQHGAALEVSQTNIPPPHSHPHPAPLPLLDE